MLCPSTFINSPSTSCERVLTVVAGTSRDTFSIVERWVCNLIMAVHDEQTKSSVVGHLKW